MQKNLRDAINERYDVLSKFIPELEKKLSEFPDGRIRVLQKNNRVYYYYITDRSDNNGTLLDTTEYKMAEQLIQKNYLEKVLRLANVEQQRLKGFIDQYPKRVMEEVYEDLPPARREVVAPIVLPDDEYVQRWLAEKYEPEPFGENEPYYATKRGDRVRSKSEQLIADRLWDAGIPYKYGKPLTIGDTTYYPDFTILRVRDRKEIYYEHLGMMDDGSYVTRNLNKLKVYALNGYLNGDNLVLTMESSKVPFDIRVVDKLIGDVFT